MLHKTCQNILLLLVLGSFLWGAAEPTVSPTPALPTTTRGQTVTVMGENLPAQGVHVLLRTGKEGKGDKGVAIDAVDEVRKAEFFRQGREKRELIKGKKWLLLSRWRNLNGEHRGDLNELFQINRRVFKAYLLKESLEGLWDYRYPGAMLNYLEKWVDQLKWQR